MSLGSWLEGGGVGSLTITWTTEPTLPGVRLIPNILCMSADVLVGGVWVVRLSKESAFMSRGRPRGPLLSCVDRGPFRPVPPGTSGVDTRREEEWEDSRVGRGVETRQAPVRCRTGGPPTPPKTV